MKLSINGYDTGNALRIIGAIARDCATGKADTLHITFDTSTDGFFKMAPQVDDTMQLTEGLYDSGVMWVDDIIQRMGYVEVKALSIPPEAKVPRNQGWKDATFLELIEEKTARYGMRVETYGITEQLYSRVKQEGQADFDFLNFRCMLESCALKLYNGAAVVYSEEALEQADPARKIKITGPYKLNISDDGVWGGVKLSTTSITAEYVPAERKKILELNNIPFTAQSEGERFCRGIYRMGQKRRKTLQFGMSGDTALAAGSVVLIDGEGDLPGRYSISQMRHDIVHRATWAEARGIL